jgi:hypothetical protein
MSLQKQCSWIATSNVVHPAQAVRRGRLTGTRALTGRHQDIMPSTTRPIACLRQLLSHSRALPDMFGHLGGDDWDLHDAYTTGGCGHKSAVNGGC